ncbi:MAG: Hpt domain-containing protein [Pseudomonadota bacterium]|nr:Hpt domain-containing protein [Pseudomonadota bacterium]
MLVAQSADEATFDNGPLSWVQAEIDEALARSLEALESFAASPGDPTRLQHARTHVHQAAGAIQMVGLDAVSAYTDEIERQLARLGEMGAADIPAACATVDRACRKLRIFLDELVNGALPVPLKLFPEYDSMQRARGVRAAAPADLFFPDLSATPPRLKRPAPAQKDMAAYLVKQRRNFQRGLLSWLHGQSEGLRQMRDAISGIEEATGQSSLRAFWWSTGAMFDAIIERGLDPSFGVKQLTARIDLQIRRLAEGSAKVADRLRREVLYYVAISAPVAPSVDAVQHAFALSALIPSAEVLNADVVGIQPHLREAREQLATAKDAWLKYTSGRAENLPKLKQTLASVHKQAVGVGHGGLMKLMAALVARLDTMGANVSDAVAMEYATALLLAESAFQNYTKLPPEFPQQVDSMLARLDAAQASRVFDSTHAAPGLEEMSRRAQDRLLLAQVGREIQTNLRHMEQVLDAFFRDHSKRAELASLVKDSAQVRGALRMLDLHTAEALVVSCEKQIGSYADASTAITDEDLELLAESLSGLGFYIEAVEQQRPDHERLIAPLLAKRRGEVPAAQAVPIDSVENAVEELRNALPQLVAELHRAPADLEARDALKTKLATLRDDAELIGDAELVANAKAAIRELDQGATAGTAMAVIVEAAASAPAPAPSAETQRLLDTNEHALDEELLGIFLEEAAEVLDTIAEQHRILSHNPSDREALRTARRQFHTLKGSGRMVGLDQLAEIAYDVEKIHNRLLEEERPVTAAVLELIAESEAAFCGWVAQLQEQHRLQPDAARIHDAIRAVEAELPRGRESVLKGREAAPAVTIAPPVVPLELVAASPTQLDRPPLEIAAPAQPAASTVTAAIEPQDAVPVASSSQEAAGELTDAEALASVLAAYRDVDSALRDAEGAVAHSPLSERIAAFAAAGAPVAATDLQPSEAVPFDAFGMSDETPDEKPLEQEREHLQPDVNHEADLPLLSFEFMAEPAGAATPVQTFDAAAEEALPPVFEIPGVDEHAWSADLPIDLELPDSGEAPIEVSVVCEQAERDEAAALEDIDVAMRDTIESVEEIVAAAPPGHTPYLTLIAGGPESDEGAVPAATDDLEPLPVIDLQQWTDHAQQVALDGDEQVTIGTVSLSRALYDILIIESDEHLTTLAHELEVLQFDPEAQVSAPMIRASHTLCGIHRAVGFALLPPAAKALEQCLLALEQRNADGVSETAQAAIASAVELLTRLAGRLRARLPFTEADELDVEGVQAQLDAVRQSAQGPQASEVDLVPALHAPAQLVPFLSDSTDARPEAAQVTTRDEGIDLLSADSELPQVEPDIPSPTFAVDAFASTGEFAADVTEPAAAAGTEHVPPATEEASHPILGVPELHTAIAAEPAAPDIEVNPLPQMPAAVETPLEEIADDLDDQLLPIFLEEAEELYPQAGEQLRHWRRNPEDRQHAGGLRRTLHTFKGSARMAGAMRLGELAHRMESRLLRGEDLAPGTTELFEALDVDLDRLAFVLDALKEGRSNIALPWFESAVAQALTSPLVTPLASVSSQRQVDAAVATGVVVPLAAVAGRDEAVAAGSANVATESEATQRAMLRVRADVIDRLVNEAGEVTIARGRVEGELRALKANLLELTNSVIRMRAQVREIEIQAESQIQSHLSLRHEADIEFDPLEFDRFTRFQELTRSLAEGINDVSTVQQALLRNVDDADAALLSQSRLSREMQQQLFSIRTVPFGSLSERLYRVLRQVSKELDKRVNLDIRGTQVELDRSVLEKLVGPLEHLLRNAVDHGIEPRHVRTTAGKAATGEITLTVRQVSNEIAIELTDDGGGLDLERIRARAVAQGRLAAEAQPTEAQLVECIFEPGFSTASRVTHVSGRGIGMDVVRSEITALGGRVEVSAQPGRGTSFVLYLPLTLAVAQAVLVRASGRLWALPAPMVEQVQQVKAEKLVELYSSRQLNWQGRSYTFHYLPRLLGDTEHSPATSRFNSVLLLRSGQGITAVHVDEMIGNQEVVVKNIGPQLARVAGIAGATVLGSGEIVLIINPVQLAQRADIPDFNPFAEGRVASLRQPQATVSLPLAMVVDDSLTVRKITGRLLAREGFDVVTAKDGLEALQRLEERRPDVILLDIEMPRMDGFEFMKTIKSDARLASIPVVMITSRTAEKHRNRARELGVDLYLGKPYQEQELLRQLREMLSVAA